MGVRKKKHRSEKRREGGFKIKTRFDKKPRKERVRPPSASAKALWSSKKTLIQNYEALGISYDPNKTLTQLAAERALKDDELSLSAAEPADDKGKELLSSILEVPEPKERKQRNLGVRERVYMKRLWDKYGDNYNAMARDVKLNTMQYTKKHLKRKIGIYLQSYQEKMDRLEAEKRLR